MAALAPPGLGLLLEPRVGDEGTFRDSTEKSMFHQHPCKRAVRVHVASLGLCCPVFKVLGGRLTAQNHLQLAFVGGSPGRCAQTQLAVINNTGRICSHQQLYHRSSPPLPSLGLLKCCRVLFCFNPP